MAAFEIPGFSYTLVAAEDLTFAQFRAVKIDPDGNVIAATVGGPIAGVLQNKPNVGEAASIMASGITKMFTQAGVTAGAKLATDNGGNATPATTGQTVIGQAITSAAGGEILSVLLTGSGHTAA